MASSCMFLALCGENSLFSSTKTKCFSCMRSLGQVITLRKKNETINGLYTLLIEILCSLKMCNPVEFEGKEIREKLQTIVSKRGSFPMEFSLLRGFHLLSTSCLPNTHEYVIICNISGANAVELGLFETAMEFFSTAARFIQDNEAESKICVCVSAVIVNNIGCAEGMIGKSQNGRETLNRVLQKLESMETKHDKCFYYSRMILLDVVRNNLARIQLDSKQVGEALYTLTDTCLIDFAGSIIFASQNCKFGEWKSDDETASNSVYGPREIAKSRDEIKSLDKSNRLFNKSCDKARSNIEEPGDDVDSRDEIKSRDKSNQLFNKWSCDKTKSNIEDSGDDADSSDEMGSRDYGEKERNGDTKMVYVHYSIHVDDHFEPRTPNSLLCSLGMNYAIGCIEYRRYTEAQEILQNCNIDKELHQAVSKLHSLLLAEVEILQGFSKQNEVFGFNSIELSLIEKSLIENSFRPSVLPCIEEYCRVLAHQGERKQAKDLLQNAVSACREVYGANHSQTLSLSQMLEGLFPIMREPYRMVINVQELLNSPLEDVVSVYKRHFIIHTSFNLVTRKEKEHAETQCKSLVFIVDDLDESLSLNVGAEDLTKLSLVTSRLLLTLEPSDDIDIYYLVKRVSSRMVLDVSARTASPKQLTLDPLFYLHSIAALCFLLEAVLVIESTRTVCLICRNLLEILILRNRLDECEDDPHMEFYKDFYGLLSWFLSYKQVSISGVSTSLLTIVTCGRESKSSGDDVITKPLFKKIDLEEDDCQEASEKPKFQPFCVVFFRSSDLLDIGELRTIHEQNSKNVFPLISPQDCILIEVVPEISQYLTNLPNVFDLLETSLKTSAEVESNSAEEPPNKLLLYSHAYQKQCIFAAETEPAVYAAVLHHQFVIKNLIRGVRKSSKKIELLFNKPQHGLLIIVSKDLHVSLRLKVLSSEPSGNDVIPNDVTEIVDDVVEKCSEHFGVSVNPNNPWRELDDRNAEPVGRENDDDDIQSVLAAKVKLEDENIDLKNKVQELTEFSEELQDKVAYLENGQNRFSQHDNVDGDSATGSSLSDPRALTYSPDSGKSTSSSFKQNYDALSTFHDQPHASNGNVAFVSPNGIPLCDGESVQTNSLSIEYNNDEMLKEIGGSEFYRERAERKVLMVSTIPQYIQELKKKRNASIQNGHTSSQVPSGIKRPGHLHRAQPMEDTNCSTSGINEATNASSFKCIDSLPEEKLISKNVTENWKESAKHSEDTTSPSAYMMKENIKQEDDREYQTHFESWPVVSGYSSVDTLKCDSLSDNEIEFMLCSSQASQNNDETDFLSLPQKSEVTSNCQSSRPYNETQGDGFGMLAQTRIQEDDSERSTDKMDENFIMPDGPSSSSKIPDVTNSLSGVNILTDSKLPDQQKCYQDSNPHFSSQPVNSSSKGCSKITLPDLEKPSSKVIQNGVEHLSIKSSLEDDRRKVNKSSTEVHDVAEVESSTRIECDVIPDGPSHIMIDSVDGQRHNKSRTYVHNTTESSKKREIEGGDNIIADGPSFFKGPSIQIGYASLVGPPPVVDTKLAGSSQVDSERGSIGLDQFHSLPSKLSQSSLSSQNSTGSYCLTEIQDSGKDRAVIPVHQILENVESGANNPLNLKTSNYLQHRSLYQISESDDSGNVAKYTQAPSWDDSNGELLGLDRSFLSRHSRDSTLRKGVFPGGHQGDYRSLPVFNHRKIEETSALRLTNYEIDGPAHVGQVVLEDRQSPKVVSNAENTTQLVSHRDNYRTNSLVNQPLKSPFPTEYILPDVPTKTRVHDLQPQLSFTPSSSPLYMIERMSSVRTRDSNNMSTEPIRSGDNMSTEPMKFGDNMSTEAMRFLNKSSQLMKSGDSNSMSTEPMVSGVSDNMPTEPMGSGVSDNMPIEPMGSGVSDDKSSEPMGSGVSSNMSTEPMGPGVSDNKSSRPMGHGVSHNMPTAEKGSGISDIPTEPMRPVGFQDNISADSPSPSNTVSNDSCATDDGYIKSLEETVTRYKTTLNSLMTEAMRAAKREREQKRKRDQEEIERQLELRRQKARDNGSPQPAKLPIQESLGDIEGSCQHFKRGCDVFFPCCNMYYPCHRCHNSSDQCDQDDSKAGNATLIRCRTCMTEQEITIESHHCKNCNKKLSEYFCGICKHFTADEKKPYHCAPCGICRIHRDNSFHCDVCNVCLNQRLRGKHKCRPDSGHDECCICLEDAFSGCQVLPCSHKVHRECAVAMLKNGVKTCPVCRSPIYQN